MKRRKIPGKTKNRADRMLRYALIALIAIAAIAALTAALRAAGRTAGPSQAEGTFEYSLTWLKEQYTGTYTGSASGGKPDGNGEFAAEDGSLTYSGGWSDGKFDGTGTLKYADGTWEEGTFIDGKRHHFVRRYRSADAWLDGVYDYGSLYGDQCEYAGGSLVGENLIANGDSAAEIKKSAKKLSSGIIADRNYLNTYVYIKGKVVYLQETDTLCYFRIDSDTVGMVAGCYTNTAGYRSKQPVIPNLALGDTVRIYGFYTGTVRYELEGDQSYYGYECVQIDPVYGELVSEEAQRGSYASVRKNPYSYCGRAVEQEFIAERYERSGSLCFILAHVFGAEEEKYVLRVEADPETFFYGGEQIYLTGFITGQRKTENRGSYRTYVDEDGEEVTIFEYVKYPLVRTISFQAR